ncbi:hypothetical protein BYT27DRAFT_7188471 [Phlegmacium glaucopus]|nr:hypothetical protein BYT27DRAFT_7188471 [Phlegmacium glaucopus]
MVWSLLKPKTWRWGYMVSEATSLPYDIVEHIIDVLAAEGDLTPVKNAALASSSILHLCRKHIFRTITFNHGHGLLKQRFISLLANNPDIVQYIRELSYEMHHHDAQLWPLLPNLLQTISHLECLRIRGALSNPEGKLDWIDMDPLLRSALLRLMYLPTLTHLDIERVRNLPISALALCINIERLDIRYVTVTPFEDLGSNTTPSLQSSQTPRILHFRNDSSQTAVGRLLQARWRDGRSVLDFTHLKRLFLDFDMFEDVQVTQELFENVKHLEELLINVQVNTQSLAGLSEMISSNARNLRSLEVMSVFKSRRSHALMIGLCEELEALTGNNVLQFLKITFVMDGCESRTLVETAFGRLEEVLMDPGWSALKCVSIEIHVRCCYRDARRLELNSVPEVYLSRLSGRKILDYKGPDYIGSAGTP